MWRKQISLLLAAAQCLADLGDVHAVVLGDKVCHFEERGVAEDAMVCGAVPVIHR
jgi:hypothetical protein